MDDAGQKLKRTRERLGLKYRDVEEASSRIAEFHKNEEYGIALSRLADIENKGTLPSIFRLYSLCAIYRMDLSDVLEWYDVHLGQLAADAARIELDHTHTIGFSSNSNGEVQLPLSLDPGIDLRKTTFLSRMIQRWGRLPLMLLGAVELRNHRYGYIGADDWFMYPLIQPGALVVIDESKRKPATGGWNSEFERPIYFIEHREGYGCGWINVLENSLILQPHPGAPCDPLVFATGAVDVVGQVTSVAMTLDPGRRRRIRS